MDTFNVSLKNFDGPFSVMLSLIEKHDIDLYDIEISLLTDQFLKYIEENSNNIDDISDFLIMAAKLLEIKSFMLIPNKNSDDKDIILIDEEDPRLWLVESLIEYKKFKDISRTLEPLYLKYGGRETRDRFVISNDRRTKFLKNSKSIEVSVLADIFSKLLFNLPVEDNNRARYFENFSFNKYNVEEIRIDILNNLKEYKKKSFFEIITKINSKEYAVTAFLAILELMKYENVDAIQGELYSDIYLVFGE
ncbi:MAG: hypothetical protein CSB15_01080 [Clostridiales bacterium]|nr:MAG: hypothetical protein CSB15_01080 [Clostridiales bacterium]